MLDAHHHAQLPDEVCIAGPLFTVPLRLCAGHLVSQPDHRPRTTVSQMKSKYSGAANPTGSSHIHSMAHGEHFGRADVDVDAVALSASVVAAVALSASGGLAGDPVSVARCHP